MVSKRINKLHSRAVKLVVKLLSMNRSFLLQLRQSGGDSITENLKDRIETHLKDRIETQKKKKKKPNLPTNPECLSIVATRTAQKA